MKRFSNLVACFLVFLAGSSCQKGGTPAEQFVAESLADGLSEALPLSYSSSNWMSALPDHSMLHHLSIPGTHDSGARHEPFPGTAKTQNLSIGDQLNAGVRFLDIRCRHFNDAFTIHHGAVYQHLNFDDVINACKSFLAAHPSETIVMSVKPEHTAENNTTTFEERFLAYVAQDPALWHLEDEIPSLGDSRGKIVLFRRFGYNGALGIAATPGWADNATFTINRPGYQLEIQDEYQTTPQNKWSRVSQFLETTKSTGYPANKVLYVNFSSGYRSILGIPNITSVSNYVNPRLNDYLNGQSTAKFGIIVADFINEDLSRAIYETNF
ncbi:phosphatidylinositol-specific phospholipase C [Parapedobacter deserti]|uniref:1-phosphatidylinositol phosphodiesterase n=1 Tax=Parapedobacter deserti TaxID=1912957 RepID=A0ABV7JPB7_9SPHI